MPTETDGEWKVTFDAPAAPRGDYDVTLLAAKNKPPISTMSGKKLKYSN